MHELGVVFRVIDMVEEVAAENNLTEIASVTLEIGEVSGILEDYLQKCWRWSVEKRSKLLLGAELIVEKIEAVTYCEGCGKTYATVEYGKICPYCKSGQTYLLRGREFNVKEIAGA